MEIECRSGLFFQDYHKKSDYQNAVIRVILDLDENGRKWDIYFMGLTEDLSYTQKNGLFFETKDKLSEKAKKGVPAKWDGLLLLTGNPKYCIIFWKRKTIERKLLYDRKKKGYCS